MTAEQKVKAKFPDANCLESDEGPWFVVLCPEENKIASIGVTSEKAWEDAASRIEVSA